MKKVLIFMLAIVFLLSFALIGIGCKSEEVAEADGEIEETAEEETDEPWTLGLTHINMTHPFYKAWIEEQDNCDANFGMKTIHKNPEANIEQQIADIDNFISQGVDVIHVNPIDVVALEPSFLKAAEAGIPILAGCNIVECAHDLATNSILPEYDFYAAMAEATAAYLDYEGKVAYIAGMVGNYASDQRQAGWIETMEKYPDIELLDWQSVDFDPAKSVEVVESWLNSYDQIDAIGFMDDQLAMPVIELLKNYGREVLICGYAGDAVGWQAVRDGDIFLDGLISPQVYAWWTSSIAYRMYMGEIIDTEVLDVPLIMTEETAGILKDKGFDVDQYLWVTPDEAESISGDASVMFGKNVMDDLHGDKFTK